MHDEEHDHAQCSCANEDNDDSDKKCDDYDDHIKDNYDHMNEAIFLMTLVHICDANNEQSNCVMNIILIFYNDEVDGCYDDDNDE